jgi:predicted RNA-binding protein (TIGR00451 family)
MNKIDFDTVRKIKGILDYQFGPDISDILVSENDNIDVRFSKSTGKIKHIYLNRDLLLNFRATNGFFTLSFHSAEKIIEHTAPPRMRVIVLNDISEFIKEGRNVFCKHVTRLDPRLRPMDEVIVVNEADQLLAIGRLMIPVTYALSFIRGIAVNVRKGFNESKI